MTNSTPFRSRTDKTMVTLVIDLSSYSHTELAYLLRSLERSTRSTGFSSQTGNRLVWQIIVDRFDPVFWERLAEGNRFELYSHSVTQHW